MKQLEELRQEYTRLFVRFLKERGEWYIWKNVFQEYGTFQKTMDLCVSTEYDRLKVNLQGIFVWTKYNIKVTLNTHCIDESKYIPFERGYIDHGSSVDENEGMDMFESEKKLHDFLFNRYSFIQIIDDNNDESFSIIGDLRQKGLIP